MSRQLSVIVALTLTFLSADGEEASEAGQPPPINDHWEVPIDHVQK